MSETQESVTTCDPKTSAGIPCSGRIWLNGEMVPAESASISVFDHGLLYGDGCFEGIRVYNSRIFKLRSHLVRMFESAEKIYLKPRWSMDEIEDAVRKTVADNNITNGYIRLVFTRGVGTLGLNPFHCHQPTAFVIAAGGQLP